MADDALSRVGRAAERAATARAELEEAIAAAQRAGHALRVIGQLAGMSHESARQILQRREVTKT